MFLIKPHDVSYFSFFGEGGRAYLVRVYFYNLVLFLKGPRPKMCE